MNLPSHNRTPRAFTLLELVVVLALISVVFSLLLLPAGRKNHLKAASIKCSSNLKQIALSFKMFAADHNGNFPFAAPDSLAYTDDSQAWLHFMTLSNELGSPKLLICPEDIYNKSSASFFSSRTNGAPDTLTTRKNSAVSYFVGLDAKESMYDSWLAGDGQVSDVGRKHNGSLLYANGYSTLRWPDSIHAESPSVAFADGSVGRGSNFMSTARWPSGTSNRLLLPQ